MAAAKKKDEDDFKGTPVGKLKSLIAEHRKVKRESDKLRGALGTDIKDARDNHRLHTRAFKAAVAEDRMEPEELADYYDHLEYYRDVLGLNARAESAPRMELEDQKDEEEEEEEEETDTKAAPKKGADVKQFPTRTGAPN